MRPSRISIRSGEPGRKRGSTGSAEFRARRGAERARL
jgi:hypothetical protein